ncbi:MAG: hypothetical protein QME94_01790 [Anaerolineae bacterium]|nr:hypothetical protein [Anaerolineae bacterium]
MGMLSLMLLTSLVLATAAFAASPVLAEGGVQPNACVEERNVRCLCCAPFEGWYCCSEGHCCWWPNCLWKEEWIHRDCSVTYSYWCQHH